MNTFNYDVIDVHHDIIIYINFIIMFITIQWFKGEVTCPSNLTLAYLVTLSSPCDEVCKYYILWKEYNSSINIAKNLNS